MMGTMHLCSIMQVNTAWIRIMVSKNIRRNQDHALHGNDTAHDGTAHDVKWSIFFV
jgi:hypothetical protein